MAFDVPLFVDPQDVIGRMQLDPELSGVTDVVSSAIRGAQLHIEALLGSKLSRMTQDCMFYLDSDAYSGVQPGGVYTLELPSGFVRTDTPIILALSTATGSQTSRGFQDPDGPFGDFELTDSRFYRIDCYRGYVLAEAGRHADRYVRVVCDTGFEPGTNPLPVQGLAAYDPAVTYQQNELVSYGGAAWKANVETTGVAPGLDASWETAYVPADQIPPSLYEAILTMVPTVFAGQVNNQSQMVLPQYERAADHARLLLRDFLRIKGFTFRPIWS
jgi:hypothetical protein